MHHIFVKSKTGSIADLTEHTFTKENSTQFYPIEPTHQLALSPNFCAVSIAKFMHFAISFFHLICYPGTLLTRPFNFFAMMNNFFESFIDGEIKPVRGMDRYIIQQL